MNASDEAVHGFYIGYKFRTAFAGLSEEKKRYYHEYALDLLMRLYENEVEYTELLYSGVGKVEDVLSFIHWNANKALQNLGFDPIFPEEICQVNPSILEALNETSDIIHDFFSVTGSSYFMPKVEETVAEDYAYLPTDDRMALFE